MNVATAGIRQGSHDGTVNGATVVVVEIGTMVDVVDEVGTAAEVDPGVVQFGADVDVELEVDVVVFGSVDDVVAFGSVDVVVVEAGVAASIPAE